MNPLWQAYLQDHGAVIRHGRVAGFGNPGHELAAAGTGTETVLSDLSHFGLILFTGEDAQSFLQGQLTCDVRQATPRTAVYGGYCNPKGRMLASFLLWAQNSQANAGDHGSKDSQSKDADSYFMQLPVALQAAIQKRLSMYVLRAKVSLADASASLIRMGIAGSRARTLVQELLDEASPSVMGVISRARMSAICLAPERYELMIPMELAPSVWEKLSRDAMPVGAPCWEWLRIRAGIPVIVPATQEQFVPQMANLEAIGGVSFQKGCYPGQEIVARTQHLGKIKRRMYLAHVDPQDREAEVKAGDELFSADMGEQSSGMVVNAEPSPWGGFDMLAILQTSSVEAGKIHFGSPEGAVLDIMPFPYSLNP